jgi:hypothetical protein
MPKAFYRIDGKWRSCNSRLHALQTINLKITKNPDLIALYMQEWGYDDVSLFKTQLAQEIIRNKKQENELRKLLNEIRITPDNSFMAYMKIHLWR